jgi:hypothetical protein
VNDPIEERAYRRPRLFVLGAAWSTMAALVVAVAWLAVR